MNGITIDLRAKEFSNVQQIVDEIISTTSYKKIKKYNSNFLVVNTHQRYMILLDGPLDKIDRVTEHFMGLQIAVSK